MSAIHGFGAAGEDFLKKVIFPIMKDKQVEFYQGAWLGKRAFQAKGSAGTKTRRWEDESKSKDRFLKSVCARNTYAGPEGRWNWGADRSWVLKPGGALTGIKKRWIIIRFIFSYHQYWLRTYNEGRKTTLTLGILQWRSTWSKSLVKLQNNPTLFNTVTTKYICLFKFKTN